MSPCLQMRTEGLREARESPRLMRTQLDGRPCRPGTLLPSAIWIVIIASIIIISIPLPTIPKHPFQTERQFISSLCTQTQILIFHHIQYCSLPRMPLGCRQLHVQGLLAPPLCRFPAAVPHGWLRPGFLRQRCFLWTCPTSPRPMDPVPFFYPFPWNTLWELPQGQESAPVSTS